MIIAFQSTCDGVDLAIRMRKPKADRAAQWEIRSLLPTGHLLCPSAAFVDRRRTRCWDFESEECLIPRMGSRLVGVWKFAALSHSAHVGGYEYAFPEIWRYYRHAP